MRLPFSPNETFFYPFCLPSGWLFEQLRKALEKTKVQVPKQQDFRFAFSTISNTKKRSAEYFSFYYRNPIWNPKSDIILKGYIMMMSCSPSGVPGNIIDKVPGHYLLGILYFKLLLSHFQFFWSDIKYVKHMKGHVELNDNFWRRKKKDCSLTADSIDTKEHYHIKLFYHLPWSESLLFITLVDKVRVLFILGLDFL
jgi:hypothetical protein